MKDYAFHIEKVSENRFELSFYRIGGHNDKVIHVQTKGYSTEAEAREEGEMQSDIELKEKPTKVDYSEQD